MRILILSAPFGSGHQRAAEAAAAALRSRGVQVAVSDLFSLVSPALSKLAAEAWTSLLKVAPSAYGAIYRWTEGAATPAEHPVGSPWALRSFLGPSLARLLDQTRPDLVATTHPAPLALAADLKRRGRRYRLLSISTDYTIHGFSVFPEVDGYCLPHSSLLPEMRSRRVPPERLFVTGIPVDPALHQRADRAEARARLGLDPAALTVAIMGGSLGMGPVAEAVQELLALPEPPLTLAFTGRNESLAEELEGLGSPHLRIIPFTDQMGLYYDAIDLLITKPGGLTLAEAIAKQVPLALLPPLPGQEERNRDFLVSTEAALAAEPGGVGAAVERLCAAPERLAALRRRVAELSVDRTADRVAEAAISLLEVAHVPA
ncbi:MAG: MGDG synthase family glycosyltransferase [Bacillota bacterium]